jgi:Sulfotransferase domain
MSLENPVRIAMWSGPRNISTAMMRAFENRDDCAVSDEPFYAAYLAATGLAHPMRDEVIASQPNDWRAVAGALLGPVPGGRAVWYQKHMCHHMLPAFGLDWTQQVTDVFLIRSPAAVLASYTQKREEVTLADIGLPQQAAIFDRVAQRLGHAPPVIESNDVLANPRGMLRALCAACGIAFSERMLSWPPGRRASDGVWAPAWYDKVEQSTGFGPARREASAASLDTHLRAIAEAARPLYERLARHVLRPLETEP